MSIQSDVRRVEIVGHGKSRTLTCPYCGKSQSVTLVRHLKAAHPTKWERWSDDFVRIYNETNDLKKVMNSFKTKSGRLVLSWTTIDDELQRKVFVNRKALEYVGKDSIPSWEPRSGEYNAFRTTLWDIPSRGTWSVHQPTYRGNWAPQVPRALIETYSRPGDLVVDPFAGGGTTLIEAYLLGRNSIGFDVSDNALAMVNARLCELKKRAERESLFGLPNVSVEIQRGDARRLKKVGLGKVDFICTHPPYGDALNYTYDNPADLSLIKEPQQFIAELGVAARRFWEVLKPNGHCAILIGDIRKKGTLHTLGFDTLALFRSVGFSVEDIIVKTQSKDRSTEFFYKSQGLRFRLAHEYLFVFKKRDEVKREHTC